MCITKHDTEHYTGDYTGDYTRIYNIFTRKYSYVNPYTADYTRIYTSDIFTSDADHVENNKGDSDEAQELMRMTDASLNDEPDKVNTERYDLYAFCLPNSGEV